MCVSAIHEFFSNTQLYYASLYHWILSSGLEHSGEVITEIVCALTGTQESNFLQLTCADLPHRNELVHLTGRWSPLQCLHRVHMPQIINYAGHLCGLHETRRCLCIVRAEYYSQWTGKGTGWSIKGALQSFDDLVIKGENLKPLSCDLLQSKIVFNLRVMWGQVISNQADIFAIKNRVLFF